MTSLWRNVSVNVVANSSWSCSSISAPKVHWRELTTAVRLIGRFNKVHGTLRALHVSLKNASTRTVLKCSKRNNDHTTTLQIWVEWKYRVWGATHEAILKLSSDAQTSFWTKIAMEKILDIFLQVQLIKPSRVLQVVWQEYVNGDGRQSKHLSLLKKVFSLCLRCLE